MSKEEQLEKLSGLLKKMVFDPEPRKGPSKDEIKKAIVNEFEISLWDAEKIYETYNRVNLRSRQGTPHENIFDRVKETLTNLLPEEEEEELQETVDGQQTEEPQSKTPDSSTQQEEKEEAHDKPVETEEVQTPVAEQAEQQTEELQPNNSTQQEKDTPKQEQAEPKTPVAEQKEAKGKKRYSRIIQSAQERTVVAPTTTVKPTVAYISKEDREKGDAQLQENLKALYDNSTLLDVLIAHKGVIKDLQQRGYDNATICKLFMDSYKFERVTPVDIEYAIKSNKRKKPA